MATLAAEKKFLKFVNEHILECAICADTLHNPKALPCLHVFCNGCISKHIKLTKKYDMYKCPACLEKHMLPDEGITGLRDSFMHKSLIEEKQRLMPPPPKEKLLSKRQNYCTCNMSRQRGKNVLMNKVIRWKCVYH